MGRFGKFPSESGGRKRGRNKRITLSVCVALPGGWAERLARKKERKGKVVLFFKMIW